MAKNKPVKLPVKVVPGSSRDCIAGWLGATLKVRVRVQPERGKANAAVEKLVADALEVSGNCVQIVSGNTSARKIIEITGLSRAEACSRLSDAVS